VKAVTEPARWIEATDGKDGVTTHCRLPSTVVVGLGNDLLRDDGVGLYVGRRLCEILDPDSFRVLELSVGGMEIVEKILGYRRAVVIDACCTGRRAPGALTRHRPEDFSNGLRLGSFHTMNFATALELARQLGAEVPEKIDVFVIEAEDVMTVAEGCTPAVAAAIEPSAQTIARLLEDEETVGAGD